MLQFCMLKRGKTSHINNKKKKQKKNKQIKHSLSAPPGSGTHLNIHHCSMTRMVIRKGIALLYLNDQGVVVP